MKGDDRWCARTGLIAQAIWDYWNVGSTKCLISVLRSESPLTSADRQLLADFVEAELKGNREGRKPRLEYPMLPDKFHEKRAAAADFEQIIKELRAKTEKAPQQSDEELRALLRHLKSKPK
jgi:hypothetical protein